MYWQWNTYVVKCLVRKTILPTPRTLPFGFLGREPWLLPLLNPFNPWLKKKTNLNPPSFPGPVCTALIQAAASLIPSSQPVVLLEAWCCHQSDLIWYSVPLSNAPSRAQVGGGPWWSRVAWRGTDASQLWESWTPYGPVIVREAPNPNLYVNPEF